MSWYLFISTFLIGKILGIRKHDISITGVLCQPNVNMREEIILIFFRREEKLYTLLLIPLVKDKPKPNIYKL